MKSHSPFQPFHRLLAVSAAVKRLAAGVEAEGPVLVGDVYVQSDVGVGDGDVGAVSCALSELVHNGVFHLVCHKLGVPELFGEDNGVDGEGFAVVKVFAPVHLEHFVIHVIGTACLEVNDGF